MPKNTFYEKGDKAYERKQYDTAIELYTKALEADPTMQDAYYSRALCHRSLDQLAEALSDYSQDIKINPKKAQSWINRGIIYLDQKEYAKALADFEKAVEYKYEVAIAYNNITELYMRTGRYNQAIEAINTAIKNEPYDTVAKFTRIQICAAMSDEKHVREYLPVYFEGIDKLDYAEITNAWEDPFLKVYHKKDWFKNLFLIYHFKFPKLRNDEYFTRITGITELNPRAKIILSRLDTCAKNYRFPFRENQSLFTKLDCYVKGTDWCITVQEINIFWKMGEFIRDYRTLASKPKKAPMYEAFFNMMDLEYSTKINPYSFTVPMDGKQVTFNVPKEAYETAEFIELFEKSKVDKEHEKKYHT